MIHDPELLEQLDSFEAVPFDDEVFRAMRNGHPGPEAIWERRQRI